MAKDAIDAHTGGSRAGGRPPAGGHVTDRPLGREGVELLSQVTILSGLSKRQLRHVAEAADDVAFDPRETVVREGMLGGAFFLIVQGQARVVRGGRTVATLLPGEFFGEVSLIDAGPRTASVIAVTPLRAIRLAKPAFDRLLRKQPDVAVAILTVLARRLRETERPILG